MDDTLSASSSNQHNSGFCPKIIPGPAQIKYIIANEFCERFSYWGVRAILIKFLEEVLAYEKNTAASITLFFSCFCYISPLIGGFLSDSYLGKYWAILVFSLIYCSGAMTLAFAALWNSHNVTFVGLGLIALGTGGIKPCVSTFGADQFEINQGERRNIWDRELERYFMAFYFVINMGSILGFLVIPLIRKYYGYFWAFLVPAISLLAALIVFLSASTKYIIVSPKGSVLKVIMGVCWEARKPTVSCLRNDSSRENLMQDVTEGGPWLKEGIDNRNSPSFAQTPDPVKARFLDRALGRYSRTTINDVRAVWELVPIFLCFPCFWGLYDQQTNT